MLDLRDDNHPSKYVPPPPPPPRPSTPRENVAGAIFLVVFLGWLPYYLIVVRPALNVYIFRVIHSYPGAVHIIPIFALPIGVLLGIHQLFRAWDWLRRR